MGGVDAPQITLTQALNLYWTLARDKTLGKSEDQLRRWRNPHLKAIRNLVAVIGDKPLAELSREDMLDFRAHWQDRLEAEEVSANSANKDLIHIGSVLKTVNKMKRLGLSLPLGDLSFKEGEPKERPPFSDEWLRSKILAPRALDRLNPEARAILHIMVNTGCRPSEVAALAAPTIHLDGSVPHISIEPHGRALKSRNARRKLALTGISLTAATEFPEGFPRYRNSSAGLSATVNKYLKTHGLLESPAHVLYSLRHSFEDRLLRAGVDERVRRDLMGHALDRERYGKGATLEMQQRVLQPLAL